MNEQPIDDLFASPPSRTVPAYGSLSPAQERALWNTDRAGWYAYAVNATAKRLTDGGLEAIRTIWPRLSRTYKTLLWPLLDGPTRELVRTIAATSAKDQTTRDPSP